jgi:hypothetical protein
MGAVHKDSETRHFEALVPASKHGEGDDPAVEPRHEVAVLPGSVASADAVSRLRGNGSNWVMTSGMLLSSNRAASAGASTARSAEKDKPLYGKLRSTSAMQPLKNFASGPQQSQAPYLRHKLLNLGRLRLEAFHPAL